MYDQLDKALWGHDIPEIENGKDIDQDLERQLSILEVVEVSNLEYKRRNDCDVLEVVKNANSHRPGTRKYTAPQRKSRYPGLQLKGAAQGHWNS
jgi:hypothetical protein